MSRKTYLIGHILLYIAVCAVAASAAADVAAAVAAVAAFAVVAAAAVAAVAAVAAAVAAQARNQGGSGGSSEPPLCEPPFQKYEPPHKLPNCISDIEFQACPSSLYLLRLSIHDRPLGALF